LECHASFVRNDVDTNKVELEKLDKKLRDAVDFTVKYENYFRRGVFHFLLLEKSYDDNNKLMKMQVILNYQLSAFDIVECSI